MAKIPRLLFVLGLVVAPVVVWATSSGLPEQVATHFGRGGLANGWMTQGEYLAFMLAMTILLPLAVVASVGFLPRFAGTYTRLPNREHWLAPGRREATLGWLVTHACSLGILLIAFLVAIHFLTLQANARTPARLDESTFMVALVGFLALLAVWIVAIPLRFRKPR